MLVNLIKSYRDVLTICDKELLGKYFEEGKNQLDIKENFFKGDKKTESEVIEIIKHMATEDATFNIVGERSINAALKSGIITQRGIKKIQGIPFALVLM